MIEKIGTFEYTGLSSNTLKESVSHTCGIGEIKRITEIPDGVNLTAILHSTSGDYFIKMQSFNRDEVNAFCSQPFILKYLQESNVSFNTPKPIGYDYTKDSLSYRWYMTEKIDGNPIDTENTTITESKARSVGRILGKINSISTSEYGNPTAPETNTKSCSIEGKLPFNSPQNWHDAFENSVINMVNRIDPRFHDFHRDIKEYVKSATIRKPSPQLLHFDYWWENILWTEDDTPYIIDWERALSGDALSNRYLSEHYLFDTVMIKSDIYGDDYYAENREELQNIFREEYNNAYTGETPLHADDETVEMYKLLPYIRELRGFPYWWRNKSEEFKQKREKALRSQVESFL